MATLSHVFRGLRQKSSALTSSRQLTSLFRGLPSNARATRAALSVNLCQRSWPSPSAFSKTCSCGVHKLTKGDNRLLNFLSSEIEYESANPPDTEQPAGFTSTVDGTLVTLTRLYPGEEVIVQFDIDHSVNQDEGGSLEEEQGEEEMPAGKIVSYPSFTVKIIKESGKTLVFHCEYDVDEVSPEENIDMFHFNYVSVLPSPDTDPMKNVYNCESENMDPSMYELLRNVLQERGINNEFAQALLDYSTNMEQAQYMVFLKNLQSFLKC